jgi:hypothetical protein
VEDQTLQLVHRLVATEHSRASEVGVDVRGDARSSEFSGQKFRVQRTSTPTRAMLTPIDLQP